MSRYQPLSVEPSAARRRSRAAFYCQGCGDFCLQVFEGVSHKLPTRMEIVGYLSGGLFAIGWWVFIDGVVFSSTRDPPLPVQIRFEDWIPGVLSTIALIIVNLINRDMLSADDSSFSGTNVATKARGCAFVGVSMALGALGGALAVTSLKYILPGYKGDAFYFGICIAAQNFLIFVSSMILWFGRNSGTEEQYPGY
ncbi:uncharacterized protein SPPG_07849 [Spizellomyces punctatus DAOM BR117]|uniref:Uncharacterized protein n=1 Tax=Spizellomyces punctatus (strain DAOM BR117) TaxID=645134 RepID=A0A0L0H6Z1_SPIPD|nr:uncharacterized protein SPPG_07849 [Spizellomyces punctatus DAOM BR117]KNC96636.1 hypothetical protein SPPG_07849 [Spizellomyces punctatus DAOM BR117]|eukprot:XP_016604676.1 hypothetical protein SPPG_07849 [Spizellomyces punctatus DAOM BR117]